EGEPEDGRPAHRDVGLHYDRQHVASADQPAVEEGKARGHQHDQAAAQQHEAGVTRIEIRHFLIPYLMLKGWLAERASSVSLQRYAIPGFDFCWLTQKQMPARST